MSGKMNNRQLYQAVFSKLQANPESAAHVTSYKGRFRISKPLAACACLAILLCAAPGVTYAATGGETYNPVDAIRVYINGEEGTLTQNEDGSYTVHMEPGDTVDIEQERSSVHAKTDKVGIPADVTIDPQSGETSIALSPAEPDQTADPSSDPS
jgi:hypothetical protein